MTQWTFPMFRLHSLLPPNDRKEVKWECDEIEVILGSRPATLLVSSEAGIVGEEEESDSSVSTSTSDEDE